MKLVNVLKIFSVIICKIAHGFNTISIIMIVTFINILMYNSTGLTKSNHTGVVFTPHYLSRYT